MPALCACKQEFKADVMVALNTDMCSQVLASKLDIPFINVMSDGPYDPLHTR